MESHLNDKEFQRLLKENADRYRMYPSERVWENIHAALHTDKRRFGFGVTTLLISAFLIFSATLVYFSQPGKPGDQTISVNDNKPVSDQSSIALIHTPEKNINDIIIPSVPSQTFLSRKINPVIEHSPADKFLQGTVIEKTNGEEILSVQTETGENEIALPDAAETTSDFRMPSNESIAITETGNDVIPAEKNITDKPMMDEETERKINEAILALQSQQMPGNIYKKQRRFSTQFYLTPTVSYRKLDDEGNVSNGYMAWQLSQSNYDVNDLVKHKPAAGLDFGFETRYRFSNKLSLKGGLQLNIYRYDIRAYYHSPEVATVAITNGYNRVDVVAAISNYRNSGGNLTSWLENKYIQAALPVGADYLLANNKKIQWGVSGSIQPTYLFGEGAYLISSNYKNYAKFPDLMRRWNVNLEGGTFIGYATGGVKWQVGPNARYQLLSSYIKGYPVREHLFAVGFKVGASFQKNK
jgi:hypothetical protein